MVMNYEQMCVKDLFALLKVKITVSVRAQIITV